VKILQNTTTEEAMRLPLSFVPWAEALTGPAAVRLISQIKQAARKKGLNDLTVSAAFILAGLNQSLHSYWKNNRRTPGVGSAARIVWMAQTLCVDLYVKKVTAKGYVVRPVIAITNGKIT
jgi:hypothetical protein